MDPQDIAKLVAKFGVTDTFTTSVAPNAQPFAKNLRTLHKDYPEISFRAFVFIMMRALAQNAEKLWSSEWFVSKKRAGLKEVFLENIDGPDEHLILQYLADNLPSDKLQEWTSSPDSQLRADIKKLILQYSGD